MLRKLIMTACTLALSTSIFAQPNATPSKQLFGYYANWDIYGRGYQPSDIPMQDLTAVIYAFAEVGNCAPAYATDASPSLCSQGSYATGTQDYKLYSTDPYADFSTIPNGYKLAGSTGKGTMANLINTAHQQKIPALLSIGGYSLSVPLTTAMDSSHRAAFISSIISFLQQVKTANNGAGFDGVDIDWEPNLGSWSQVTPQQLSNYVSFLSELKASLKANYASYAWLTIAAPANPAIINKIGQANWLSIESSVDYINVMAYDYHGAFDDPKVTNMQAPLYHDPNQPNNVSHRDSFNVDTSISAYLNNGVDPSKLILGFPSYGRAVTGVPNKAPASYPNATGLYQNFTQAPQGEWDATGTFDYNHIIGKMLGHGFTDYQINSGNQFIGVAAFSPKSCDGKSTSSTCFISYDNLTSVGQKAIYVKTKNLGGMMEWELSGDVHKGDPSYAQTALIHAAKSDLALNLK